MEIEFLQNHLLHLPHLLLIPISPFKNFEITDQESLAGFL
jgi:hypothetical protein